MFRAGDVVKHGPSKETWVLACDEENGDVLPAGWPETMALAHDCTLEKAATDEERLSMLRQVAASCGNGPSHRQQVAAAQLARTPEGIAQERAQRLEGPVHAWFELTYAQYLTVPRSILQSMPVEWQARFAQCLRELDAALPWRPQEGRYWVQLRDGRGRYRDDPFADYRHVPVYSAADVATMRGKAAPEAPVTTEEA